MCDTRSCDDSLSRTDDRAKPVVPMSVHIDCIEHENLHKWCQSRDAGYDMGEASIRDWVNRHWMGYLRARWVEHLQGKVFWVELKHDDFGLLQREFTEQRALLYKILDRLKSGEENLHVIIWAIDEGIPFEPVHAILKALNVNGLRLRHRFEAA
jgi:hypothetical protein